MLCPKCKNELHRYGNVYKCCQNHSYDIAKEGYVNLLLSRTDAGDDKELVNGRINFLSGGYYQPLRDYLEKIIAKISPKSDIKLLDMGCGTGYYTASFSKYGQIYGLDISKNAIKYAAKHDKNSTYLVASNRSVPFNNDFFDILVHIFSPLFENEDQRILKSSGYLITVEPGKNHLIELKNLLYKNPYLNEEKSHSYQNFEEISKESLDFKIKINDFDLHNLVMMTPYFYTTNKDDLGLLKVDTNIEISCDFLITIYQKKN